MGAAPVYDAMEPQPMYVNTAVAPVPAFTGGVQGFNTGKAL